MFTYSDGLEVKLGDQVLFESGRTPGTVELIVNTSDEMKAMNVGELGILLKSVPFGRVYLPESYLKLDPIRLAKRAGKRNG
jgi:hypothetical protein